jgi:membrane protease YdiL (CAAX protease family)
LAIIAFFWHATFEDTNDIWRLDAGQGWFELLATPLVGIGAGMVVVQGFRLLEGRMAWLPLLHREFRAMFGRPGDRELLLLAGSSAIGEELLFRGAMLDAWGFWASSLVFALLHIPPRRALWPWTISSLLLGLALAAMTLQTGNLGAAVAMHFVINWRNMRYITKNAPAFSLRGPVRPREA